MVSFQSKFSSLIWEIRLNSLLNSTFGSHFEECMQAFWCFQISSLGRRTAKKVSSTPDFATPEDNCYGIVALSGNYKKLSSALSRGLIQQTFNQASSITTLSTSSSSIEIYIYYLPHNVLDDHRCCSPCFSHGRTSWTPTGTLGTLISLWCFCCWSSK